MIAALLLALAPPADYGPVHEGFFLRMDLGLGYYSATGGGNSITGGAGGLGIAIGGNIAENVALFGELFDAAAANPTVNSSSTQDVSAGIGALGVGVTWYLMPANVFFAGTLGIGRMILSVNGQNSTTDAGLVGRVGLGKEWMVSRSWGLGVAGYLNFGVNKDQGGSPTWTTLSPILSFSATFY